MWISFLWISSCLCLASASTRKLTTVVNPECGVLCENSTNECYTNLVYIKSEGPLDTLHHVWTTVGKPSFLLLETNSSASLKFKWREGSDGPIPEIICTEKSLYAFALVFNKIWEYRDPKDVGKMSSSMENLTSANFDNFCWENISIDQNTAYFRSNLSTSENFIKEGVLTLQLETQGQDGRSEIIPRLLYTSNTSQVRVVLDGLKPQFDESRFAIDLSVFGTEEEFDSDNIFQLRTVKSMDDEYTPGVFKSLHLLSKGSADDMFGSFLSWKPVAYTTDALSVTDSTSTVYSNVSRTDTSSENSVAATFLNETYKSDINGTNFITSFGNSQDGFYSATKYTQWTFAYGLGVPGEDKLSTLIIIVIASGLGLPMLLIVLSTAYLIWHKMHADKDDLLLSRN